MLILNIKNPSIQQLGTSSESNSPVKRPKLSVESSLAVLSCPKCHLEFSNVDDLDNHIESSHVDGDDDDDDEVAEEYDDFAAVADVTFDEDDDDDMALEDSNVEELEMDPRIIVK
jgi:hypothetical protein